MSSAPAITICIPSYKAERYLPQALRSVAEQTWADWELIVTEDGSRDGAEKLVQEFARTVPQSVRYTRHDPNRGLPATRNASIREARGQWIALLDADDYWAADHLASLWATAERTGADLVHSGCMMFDSDSGAELGVRAPSPEVEAEFPRSLFVADYIIQPASVMLKKSLWQRVGGFDETYRYVEDREMWLRCARNGARFAHTGRNSCYYRKHAEALSMHAAEMAIANARVFQQHLDWESIEPRLRRKLATEAWVSAARILQRAEPGRAAEYLRRAQEVTPTWGRFLRRQALHLYALTRRGK